MGIAITLHQYLNDHQIPFEPVPHARTGSSLDNAEVCQLPRERVAKGVVLKQREGYLLAVVPASRSVSLDDVGGWLHQPVALATEEELAKLFPDCERVSMGPELSANVGYQFSLGGGDGWGPVISRFQDRCFSFLAGGHGVWARRAR